MNTCPEECSCNKGITVTPLKALTRIGSRWNRKLKWRCTVPEDHRTLLCNYPWPVEATDTKFALKKAWHTSAFVSWLRACPQPVCSLADSKDIRTHRAKVAAWSISPFIKRPSSLFLSPITRLVNSWVTWSVAVRQGSSLGDGFIWIKLYGLVSKRWGSFFVQ